jgi:aryl-alcohol dehydrogenase-like predicted oxidoreductase
LELRTIGKTDVKVSCLGFGGGAFAGLLVRGSFEQQVDTIRCALDGGLTYFDTAAQYGDGLSEQNLGRALAALGATSQAVLGTKVRMTPAELADPAPVIRASLVGSLQRLQRDYVDVFVQHNFPRSTTDGNGVLSEHLPAVAAAMRDLQREGLVRCIGLTGVGETQAVIEAIRSGLFDFTQCYYNALNPSAAHAGASGGGQDFGGALRIAQELGVGGMAVRSVAGGALVANDYRAPLAGPTGTGGGLGGNPYNNDLVRAQRLQPLVESLGLENALEFGVRFAISEPNVASALVGFSDQEQIEAALRWANRGPLPAGAITQAVELARLP